MGRWRQAHNERARPRIAEARHRPRPILLARECRARLARDPLSPGHEARTAPAAAHLLGQRGQFARCVRRHWAVVASLSMSLWMLIMLFGLIKLPIAALMLWFPFRDDAALQAPRDAGSADSDGGSHALPGGPPPPHPRGPYSRRPHGPRHGSSRLPCKLPPR